MKNLLVEKRDYQLSEVADICGLSLEEATKEVCDCDLINDYVCAFHQNPELKCTLSTWQQMGTEMDQYGISHKSKFIPLTEIKSARLYGISEVAMMYNITIADVIAEACTCDLLNGYICPVHLDPNVKYTLSKWQELSDDSDQYGCPNNPKIMPVSHVKKLTIKKH